MTVNDTGRSTVDDAGRLTVEETRRRLGEFGVWVAPAMLRTTPVPVLREQAARIERLGFGSLWTGEPPAASPGVGREVFTLSAVLLAATERLAVGAGIANIGLRVPMAMHGGAATIAEAYPGRFVLGLGGQTGDRPLGMLSGYLAAMDEAATRALPGVRYPRVLGALGPKALALAAERADGVHTFMQPVEHTRLSRAALGPGPLLIPQQAIILGADGGAARGRLRALLGLGDGRNADSPYARSYRRLGYGDEDLAGARSDRLIDATLAWGDEEAVAGRLNAHLGAGADHVLLHPIADGLTATVDQLERIAPLLAR